MLKIIKLTEIILIPAIALISLLISLADFFGLLNQLPWISIHIPALTLLLVSLTMSSLSIIHSKLVNLQDDVHTVLSNEVLAAMRRALERIDPNLRKIFEDDMLELVGSYKLAVTENTFRFSNVDRFRYYYIRTLQNYPKATFLATSLASSAYFWKNQAVEEAIAQFIRKGGKMQRLFFVNGPEELAVPEVQEILARQCEIGVEVYITDSNLIPNDLKKFIFIELHGKIAWEVFIDAERRIKSVVATTDHNETIKYLKLMRTLLHEGKTQRYLPK